MCTHGSAEPHQGAHPCPAFDLVMPGRRLTLRVDAEVHQKEKKICLFGLSFPKCYSNTSWWLILGGKPRSSTFKPKENLVEKIKGKQETADCVSSALPYFLCIRENPGCPEDSSAGWAGKRKPTVTSCVPMAGHQGRLRVSPLAVTLLWACHVLIF